MSQFIAKTIIYLFTLSLEMNDETGQSVQIIHKIAIDLINHSSEILQDFWLEWKPYDSPLEQQNKDILHSLIIGSSYAQYLDNKTIFCPIAAGPTWGKSVSQTHENFDFYNMIHIGSCATHNMLTEKQSFFRTIATDLDQANIILKLCHLFNWTEVGFVYLDPQNGYNDWLKEAVKESNSNITIHSTFYKNTKQSMQETAKLIYDKKLYITVLYVRGDHLKDLFIELEKLGATSYPYFYITTDISWFDHGFIAKYNLTKYVNNLLGIVPGAPYMFNQTIYKEMSNDDGKSGDVWQTSNELMDKIIDEWHTFDVDILNIYSAFAFDSIMAIALAMDEFFKQYSFYDIDAETRQKIIRDILLNKIAFNGASGRIEFDENGDCKHGIMALVNIVDGVPVTIGGIFGDKFYIDQDMIEWPSDFIEHGAIPQPFVDRLYLLYILSFSLVISMIINAVCFVIWSRSKRKDTRNDQTEIDMTEQEDSAINRQSYSNSHLDSKQHDLTKNVYNDDIEESIKHST